MSQDYVLSTVIDHLLIAYLMFGFEAAKSDNRLNIYAHDKSSSLHLFKSFFFQVLCLETINLVQLL